MGGPRPFSLKEFERTPAHPPQLKTDQPNEQTYEQDAQPRGASGRERLEPCIMQCIIQYGDHEPSSAFETKAFLLS